MMSSPMVKKNFSSGPGEFVMSFYMCSVSVKLYRQVVDWI